MKIISKSIKKDTVLKKYNHFFETMIKAVVDIKNKIIALDGELHADLESALLDQDSDQEDVWGINLYLEKAKNDRIDYIALINIRPSMGNCSMEIQDPKIRGKIKTIVESFIID